MNNNRNNNRRRGRGNRSQGGGGGHQANRIDSRARGNAPQMLDKYKKLAQDAQHNGDRVQAEYYLQFADHYFRVIADNRTRQDEQRGDQRSGRRDEREQDEFEIDDEDGGDFGGEDRRRFETRRERPARDERPRNRPDESGDDRADQAVSQEGSEGAPFEPADNPFAADTRDEGAGRGRRGTPRPRRANGHPPGIDAAVLPPAFSANDADDREEEAPTEPAPRRRRKRSDGGTLSAVG